MAFLVVLLHLGCVVLFPQLIFRVLLEQANRRTGERAWRFFAAYATTYFGSLRGVEGLEKLFSAVSGWRVGLCFFAAALSGRPWAKGSDTRSIAV